MRLDWLELRNFKRFREDCFEFPRTDSPATGSGSFHVLIGENGAGKTSLLDAAAVGLGVWLERIPDSILANSQRRLTADQKTLNTAMNGDRTLFQQADGPMSVRIRGSILDRADIEWGQALPVGKRKITNSMSKPAIDLIADTYRRILGGEQVLLPVICYYGAGRAWLAHNERKKFKAKPNGAANRWEAFYDCLNERIRVADLAHWFQSEHIAMGNRQGRYRPGFDAVRRAVLACIPGADSIWFDGDFGEIIVSIDGNPQPYSNLSAGQKSLFSLVADLAIKMVTQNNHLVPPDALGPEDEPLPRVLAQTPGVVLIDELDLHLHPIWQRRVSSDLRRIFPAIQFIATTHSPQVVGGVKPEQIIRLLPQGHDRPAQSYGMDTNWILQVLMGADDMEPFVIAGLKTISDLIAERKLSEASSQITNLRQQIGNSEALQRAASTIERIRMIQR